MILALTLMAGLILALTLMAGVMLGAGAYNLTRKRIAGGLALICLGAAIGALLVAAVL